MAIVTNIVKRVEIPHEPGEWMEFKRLSWRQLENASDIATDALMQRLKAMGGDILQVLRQFGREQAQNATQSYDRKAILLCGISKWSYDAPVNEETIDLLDEETAAWAFGEILELNKPRMEEDTKNA